MLMCAECLEQRSEINSSHYMQVQSYEYLSKPLLRWRLTKWIASLSFIVAQVITRLYL